MNLDTDDFTMWAFGNAWITFLSGVGCPTLDLMNSWNDLHGELLMLQPESSMEEDIELMRQLWVKHSKDNLE